MMAVLNTVTFPAGLLTLVVTGTSGAYILANQTSHTFLRGPFSGSDTTSFFGSIIPDDLATGGSAGQTFGIATTGSNGTFSLVTPYSGKVLFDHYVDAGNVTTGETDLYSDTTAASQLGANGDKLSCAYGGIFVSSATATREIRMYFGGSSIFDTGALTLSLSSAWTMYVELIRVSASVVRYMASFTTEGAALAAYTAVGELTGLTLSGTNVIKITGQAAAIGAATNDIVAKMGYIEFKPA